MATRDGQFAGRLLHVCPDPTLGRQVQAIAEQAGLDYHRFPDAFAAALALLRLARSDGILLLALDGLARMEFALARWAATRWPNLTVLAHGSPDRLNGQTTDPGLRRVEWGQLARLIGEASGGHPRSAYPPERFAVEATPPEPEPAADGQNGQRADAIGLGDSPLVRPSPAAPSGPQPSRAAATPWRPTDARPLADRSADVTPPVGPIVEAAPPEAPPDEPATGSDGSDASPGGKPALRVHRPDRGEADRPIVSEAELQALLGPVEGDDDAG